VNKKTFIFSVIIAVAVLVVLVIVIVNYVMKNSNDDDSGIANDSEETSAVSALTDIQDTSILVKTWYSDRKANDLLTFTEDGSYIGTNFLNSGRYTLNNGIVTCSGVLDGAVKLEVAEKDGKVCLYYENGALSFYFHDEEATAIKSMEDRETAIQERAADELMDILLGVWTAPDRGVLLKDSTPSTRTNTFYENEYVLHQSGEHSSTYTYSYYIKEYTYENNIYRIKVVVTESTGFEYESYINISKRSDKYRLVGDFMFSDRYEKDIESVEAALTGAASTNDSLDKANSDTVKTVETTTAELIPLERNEDFIMSLNERIDKNIIGTWEGSTGDFTNPDRTVYKYVFNDDGTYEFSIVIASGAKIDGYPYSEKGTYKIVHSGVTQNLYYSTLIMKHGSSTTEQNFYLSGTDLISLVTEDDTDPTFLKM
jgi:hypothetical protein